VAICSDLDYASTADLSKLLGADRCRVSGRSVPQLFANSMSRLFHPLLFLPGRCTRNRLIVRIEFLKG
jgi:hypothetical protein